jgi:hypothetical protein
MRMILVDLPVTSQVGEVSPAARNAAAQTYREHEELRGWDRRKGRAIPQPLNPPCEPVGVMFAPTFVKLASSDSR